MAHNYQWKSSGILGMIGMLNIFITLMLILYMCFERLNLRENLDEKL